MSTARLLRTGRRAGMTCLTAALLASCATSRTEPGPEPLLEGFTCCNLHYDGDWISDANWGALPFLPAGMPARITGYGRHRVFVEIDGKPYRLGHDYGRQEELLSEFAEKYIVADDPRRKIARFPAEVQEAISQGKVMYGMTREQVIVSLGYPRTSHTLHLDEPVWHYWTGTARVDRYHVLWGADGRVKGLLGAWQVLKWVWLLREPEPRAGK